MKILSSAQVRTGCYQQGLPFQHLVLDGLFLPKACREIAKAFPPMSAPGWCHYDTPLERKSVFNGRYAEPPQLQALYDIFAAAEFADLLCQITGKDELEWDNDLYAAGLSVAVRGGKLDLHRDADTHPLTGWRRELSCVLFLNDDWQEEWGGGLELWSERDAKPFNREKVIAPQCGRFVIFDPSGFHGYPDPLTCPEGVQRKVVQVFYWSDDGGLKERQRAVFAPRPTDPSDEALDLLRARRAQLNRK